MEKTKWTFNKYVDAYESEDGSYRIREYHRGVPNEHCYLTEGRITRGWYEEFDHVPTLEEAKQRVEESIKEMKELDNESAD